MGRHEVEGFNLRPLDAHQPILASSKSRGEWCNYPRVIESKFLQSREDRAKVKGCEWIPRCESCNFSLWNLGSETEWRMESHLRRFEVTEETVLTYSESNVISRSLDVTKLKLSPERINGSTGWRKNPKITKVTFLPR